jgi:hypothetical protein
MSDEKINKIASMILADEQYVYDPKHEMSKSDVVRELGSQVHITDKGWGRGDASQEVQQQVQQPIPQQVQVPVQKPKMPEGSTIPRSFARSDWMNNASVSVPMQYLKGLMGKRYKLTLDKLNRLQKINLDQDEANLQTSKVKDLNNKIKVLSEQLAPLKAKEEEGSADEDDAFDIAGLESEIQDASSELYTTLTDKKSALNKTSRRLSLCNKLYKKMNGDISAFLIDENRIEPIEVHGLLPERESDYDNSRRWLNSFVGQAFDNLPVYVNHMPQKLEVAEEGRAYYSTQERNVTMFEHDDEGTLVHEVAHMLEHKYPKVHAIVKQFYDRRTEKEDIVPMAYVDSVYWDTHEYTKTDNFIDPYMGKWYEDGTTEILSMGLEYMYRNPSELLLKDPDMFETILKAIKELRKVTS